MPRPKKSSKRQETEEDVTSDDATEGKLRKKQPKGVQFDDVEDESPSEGSDDEDEDAVLLTNKVEEKIFKTLLDIKNKNPAIYDPNVKCFSDSDFEDEGDGAAGTKPSKGVTYKDMVRETLLKKGAEGFESDGDGDDGEVGEPAKTRTYQEEQEDLKKAFLSVANELDDDVDFFKKSEATDVLPAPRITAKKSAGSRLAATDEGLISRYWAPEQPIDEEEEFLKDYILNQRWREDKLENFDYAKRLRLDQEDEEHLDKADEFEYKYNYRFEEEGGATIEGHPRTIEDSVRKVDERRKKKRKEKKQQQMEEKVRRDEEIKRLKKIKRAEIEQRMREIEAKAGVQLASDVVDLNAPFDPEQHEKDMASILGKDYHEQQEDDDWNPAEDCEEDDELWWLCDHCHKGIPAGHKHFDCTECDNYSLCQSCVPLANHEHQRMVAKVVPAACAPPEVTSADLEKLEDEYYKLDYEDMIGDMKVRFKYRQVEPYKCDLQTILQKSDKELNAIMPLSKLLAYDAETPLVATSHSGKEKRAFSSHVSGKLEGPDRRMTKYNVNRDRLQAFGLKESKKVKGKKDKKHKKKKSHGAKSAAETSA
ncbi:Krr1 family protein [Babesia caballi]|uniref:Krr1 family protein n=1 Tax=Babesia caballi TaxID=5871 RepID=A0AAV4M3A5_BABCB|nr:Krr1 family protein [Babesia caballi]